MRAVTWKAFAMRTTAVAVLSAVGVALYLAVLVYEAGGILPSCLTFGLVLDAVLRRAICVASWFWPEQCNPAWLQANPPLFRFDRLRGG